MNDRIRIGATNRAILSGEADLSAWSDEELMRGQRRDLGGHWRGRPPTVVPRAVHDELVRRKMSAAHDLLRDNVVSAVQVLINVANDNSAEPGVRLKAASLILDRVLGKASERVQISVEPAWAVALRGAVIDVESIVSLGAGELEVHGS